MVMGKVQLRKYPSKNFFIYEKSLKQKKTGPARLLQLQKLESIGPDKSNP